MSGHRTPLKVMIADDHPVIVLAVTEIMRVAVGAIQVESVPDGDALLKSLETKCFDFLVLDLHMPGQLRSVPLIREVIALQPTLQAVIYTGADHPCLAKAAMDSGAKAYISKSSGPDVAIEAIREVLSGRIFVDPAIDIDMAKSHPWFQLTPGERAILISLANGQSLQVIAIDSERSYKTVTAHKYNAFRKLGLRSKDEMGSYLTHHGLGYLIDSTY